MLFRATKFRHCKKECKSVSRQVNFGHDFNESLPCIGHDFSHVVLGEIATNRHSVTLCAGTEICLLVEGRKCGAFHSITLIVAEV